MAAPGRTGRQWRELRERVIHAALLNGESCPECDIKLNRHFTYPHPLSLTVDHIVPLSVDFSRRFDPKNLRAMHYLCNNRRGARTEAKVDRRVW